MSSIYNVILVIAAQWICQGITVQPSNQNKVFLLLPKTTPLPPQLAYYVQGRRPDESVYKNNEHLDKSASTHNGGVLSVIEAPYSERIRPTNVQNSKFGFVQNHKYPKLIASPNQPSVYQSSANDPSGSYNYRQYYGPIAPNGDSIVRATPPPERRPGRTPPPPSKKVTFQVNMQERKYRAQQDYEQRNRSPHFRNQAIRQVQPPSLTTVAPRNHKVLRSNINHLKKSQQEHFNLDDDEHPAQLKSKDDDVEEITPKYEYKYQDLNQFRDKESQYDRLKKHRGPGHSDDHSNYEEIEPKFTNFYDEIEEGAKYVSHADFVTPTSYQNFNNDHGDQFETPNFSNYKNYDDHSDEPSPQYNFHDSNNEGDQETFNPYQKNIDSYGAKAYITNDEVKEFDKYLRSTPRFVGPKKKQRIEIEDRNGYNDRSDKGDDHDFVPYKMLASVRHSEKYEHQPKDLSNPALKERILEKGGHVVYTEQGYEDKQYDHGNEEKFANVKHRKRRHVSEEKFPFYYSSTRNIPKHSAIRYVENGEHLRNGKTTSLYNTKRKICDDVEFDETNVNDKEVNFKSKKRLTGLEDKIDCLKVKLFGAEPLNNPIFQEHYVDESVPIVKPRRTRSNLDEEHYSTLVNVFDDVTSNIEQSSASNEKNDNTPSESSVDYVVFPPYVDLANSKMNSKSASILDILTNATSNHTTKPPVVILMEEQAFAQMKKNDSRAKYTEFFKYPQSDGTEVFIFDISKFIPKFVLPVNDDYYDSEESIATTDSIEISTEPPKKSAKMKLKMRRNHKKNLDWNPNKHLPRRRTNVLREGIQLAKQPYLLPGSYNLHEDGKMYR